MSRDSNQDRAAAEVWQAFAEARSEETLALGLVLMEFVKAVEAGDDESLPGLASGARRLLRHITNEAFETLAEFEIASEPDWLDKLRAEEEL